MIVQPEGMNGQCFVVGFHIKKIRGVSGQRENTDSMALYVTSEMVQDLASFEMRLKYEDRLYQVFKKYIFF